MEALAAERVKNLMVAGKSTDHDSAQAKLEGEKETEDQESYGIDESLVEEGKAFFKANFFSIFVSMLTGLWTLMYIKSIVRVLSMTKQSHTPTLAFKRYLSTLRHVVHWHKGVEEMKESLKVVKSKHSAAALRSKHNAASDASKKSSKEQDHGISQFDMVVTQWAFIGPTLLFPTELGMSNDLCSRELEGLVYIMYLVGRHLGVHEEYNLCRGGLDKARAYSREILVEVIQPAVTQNLDYKELSSMAGALLSGINILNPFTEPVALQTFTLKLFMMEELIDEKRKVSNYSFLMSSMMDIVLNKLLHLPKIEDILRTTLNNLMRLNIFIAWNWRDFLCSYYNYKGVHVHVCWLDRLLAVVAIPFMSSITGAAILWREVDKINLLLVISFYVVVFLMLK